MSKIVHIILPTGTRFERPFPDDHTPEMILQALEGVKATFGFNGTVKKMDKTHPKHPVMTDFGDPKSGLVYDNPDTQVVILQSENIKDGDGNFLETRVELDDKNQPVVAKQLKGEPKKEKQEE